MTFAGQLILNVSETRNLVFILREGDKRDLISLFLLEYTGNRVSAQLLRVQDKDCRQGKEQWSRWMKGEVIIWSDCI